jgi:nicotinic acid phosphoribosyltransferase
VKELLASSFDLSFEVGTNHYRYESGEQAWQLWVNHYGPTKTLAANLDDAARDAFRRDLIAWHESFPSALGFDQPRDYLVTRGVRK